MHKSIPLIEYEVNSIKKIFIDDLIKLPPSEEKNKSAYNIYACSGLTTISSNEWNNLLESGIINPDTVLSQMLMKKEEAVKKIHKYAITQLTDGRFGTYVPSAKNKGGRQNIKASNEAKLYEKLYDYYYSKNLIGDEKSKSRLHDIFDEWLDYKAKKNKNSPNTKKRNIQSYNKYVRDKEIDLMPLNNITTLDIEKWAIEVLSEFNMTSKDFNTHKIVVMNTLVYAKRKGYITENPWNAKELEYKQLLCSPRRKPSEEMIFYPDEIEELLLELEECYERNGNVAGLGLMINFDLGLRIGELCALRWSDINWKNETIFIQRQEDSEGVVVEYVKADSEAGYRELFLTPAAIRILKRIREESRVLSEYIFCNEYGERKLKIQFINKLIRTENVLGYEKAKGTHCIRRTVASRMNASGIPLDEIRRWLGHTDSRTTLGYIFNPYRENETKKKIMENSIIVNHTNCLQVSSRKDTSNKQKIC